MTVKEMRLLLKGLPGDMEVVMPLDDDNFITVCAQNSQVMELQLEEDDEDDSGEITEVLLLVGCSCKSEYEVDGLNSQPELN